MSAANRLHAGVALSRAMLMVVSPLQSSASRLSIVTSPHARDTDGDWLTDYFEVGWGGNINIYDPYHPTSNPNGKDLDANRVDTDGDGVSDYDEYHGFESVGYHFQEFCGTLSRRPT